MQLAAFTCLLATAVATSPQVNFPLNLQLPPVARVDEAYSFQFAATTFQPDPDQLIYSIAGGPAWLHINSENRTLWGTPKTQDAGTATFTIVAAGEAGGVANMETQLPVENDDAPQMRGNISQALSKAGQLSGPQSVTLLPSQPFEIVLGQDIFQANGEKLSYSATLADHTPLPSWLSFETDSLRFAGTTPWSANPQTFEILLVASDTPNFAAASTLFSLVVSSHILLFKPLAQTVNVSKGDHVDIKGLKGMVYLDNAPIRDEDIQSASVDAPNWLSFDTTSFDITGDPPSGLMSQDITVTVQDKFGGSAQQVIHLAFSSELFNGEVGRLNVTVGVHFEYQIPKSILTLESETISMEFGQLNKWLSFNSESLTISGTIPNGTTACSVEGSMTATSPDGKTKDTQTFQIEVLSTSTNDISDPLNSGIGSGKHNDVANADAAKMSRKRIGVIVGAVLASLIGAAVIIILALALCRRRKKGEKGYISPKTPRSPQKKDISRPIPQITAGFGDVDRAEDEDLEKGKLDDSPPRDVEPPPQRHYLLPSLGTQKKLGHSRDTSLNEQSDNILTTFQRDVRFTAEAGPSHHPHDSMKIPTDMLRRKSASSPSDQRRHTSTVSRNINRNSGQAGNRRVKGVGNTRHSHSPSGSVNCSVANRTLSSSSCTTALSTVPSALPQVSKARHTTQLTTPAEKRQSIRPVVPSYCESSVDRLLDRRPLEEKRHSYIRNRASAQQSPLFAGSRLSLTSFRSPPTFMTDSSPMAKSPFANRNPNIVKPDDTILSSEDSVPESLRIRKPLDTPSPATNHYDLSKSLRNKSTGVSWRRHTEAPSMKSKTSDEKLSARPETAVYAPTATNSRASTQASLRSADLLKGLNEETGTKIWDDVEVSDSNYSGDEDDIEEGQRRATLKPSNSVTNYIGPLRCEKSKRDSKRNSKRNSKRESRILKKASERDPTPFHLRDPDEHGGKENLDSVYSIRTSSPPKSTTTSRTKRTSASSPTRPKISVSHRPKVHSRNFSRVSGSPSNRTSLSSHPLPRVPSPKERHSRKSLHSRSQSRHSTGIPKRPRERSHTQDSAYPFFPNAAAQRNSTATSTTRTRKSTLDSPTERDGAGNVVGYGEDEPPRIEMLRRESFGVVADKGRVNTSRLTQLHDASPFFHSKRDTVTPATPVRTGSVGLGLSLLEGGHPAEDATPGPGSVGKGTTSYLRERTPLGVLDDGNGGSPERVRLGETRSKRPVSVEVDEGQKRKGFGSLKARWEGGSIFRSRESKAFL